MKKLILISALLISFYAMAYDVRSETSTIDQNRILARTHEVNINTNYNAEVEQAANQSAPHLLVKYLQSIKSIC